MVVPGISLLGGVTGMIRLLSSAFTQKGAFSALLLAVCLRKSKLRSATSYPRGKPQKQQTVSAGFRRLSVSQTTSLASHTAHHLHVRLNFAPANITSKTRCRCFSGAEEDTLPPWVRSQHCGRSLLGMPQKTEQSPALFLPSVNPLDIILISILVEQRSSLLILPSCILQV